MTLPLNLKVRLQSRASSSGFKINSFNSFENDISVCPARVLSIVYLLRADEFKALASCTPPLRLRSGSKQSTLY